MVTRISTGSPFERSHGYSRAVVDGDRVYVSDTTMVFCGLVRPERKIEIEVTARKGVGA